MEEDRELFIQQLVAALQENTALAGGVSYPSSSSSSAADGSSGSDKSTEGENSPQQHTGLFLSAGSSGDSERLAQEAYMQLQFDFPQLQEASIEALAGLYRRVSVEKSTQHVAAEIPITATLLDGVAFLNGQSPSYGISTAQRSRSSEGSALLAASLLLLVFRVCLESPEAPRVEALLSSLEVKQPHRQDTRDETSSSDLKKENAFVEKYAAQEDPDDLSEVYEGHLPEPRAHRISKRTHQTSNTPRIDKLRYLVSCTFSSSFASVSMEKWEQWRLDDELVAITRLLVDGPSESNDTSVDTSITLYGPRGEWNRYLYVLRDRVLRFPGSSRSALWRLKELIEFLTRHNTASTSQHQTQPQHVVYRVLAELAISREFHRTGAQRAQQDLSLVIQELLPSITQEVQQLASNVTSRQKESVTSDELAVVFLQLLHFLLFASPNARTTTEKLHENGMLRTLVMFVPILVDGQMQRALSLPALLRLLGECALWHAGFATYISRVPKFVALLPTLREQFVAEELVLALAFRQHQVDISTTVDIWNTFVSESLFPLQCDSFLEAMKKLQDAVFVLDCLEKVLAVLRPVMHKEIERGLQRIYSGFGRSFEYPTFAAAETARQQQQFEQRDDNEKDKKKQDRGQAEVLQFTALRNKLRQSVKALLAALSSGAIMGHVGGRASSKLD
ncbi:hypothetical protein GN244_ATG19959 [Phytophthora infestans]|uniref:Uncharacterized protein n=1 Tax=Phytophthora infestans TaxID=4787 RepID=A0A833W4L1_PHYIN|nr:hypothetical protein GN244_ATG19959 [Phytophthora infestans]